MTVSPAQCLLDDPLQSNASIRPRAIATVCGDGRWTWRALGDRVGKVASALIAEGVVPGDRVAWVAQNCHRYLETFLACAQIGAVFTPLNWRLSSQELSFVLQDSSPRIVLWQQQDIGEVVAAARAIVTIGAAWRQIDGQPGDHGSFEDWIHHTHATRFDRPPADDPVLLLYTGSVAGHPYGVLLSHTCLLTQAWYGIQFGELTDSDIYLNCGPLFHVGTLKTTLATYAAGGTNVFVRRSDPLELCQTVERERCTGAFLQPATIEKLVEINQNRRFDLSSLRAKPGTDEWNDMISPLGPGRYRSGYGQTELGGVVTFHDAHQPALGNAGFPAPLLRVEALGADGSVLAPGHTGELAVRGPVVACGYHARPEEMQRRQQFGWHHTNDIGRTEADGSVSFIGPKSPLIKSAAENVYPTEVEVCLRQHMAVKDVGVLGVPDPVWGQAVTAVVVADGDVSAEELIAHCRAHIASYKKPRHIVFADRVPRREGDIDRDALNAAFGGGGYPGAGQPR
jgi:acyl-CoA synthetase (AMP-forming)/AMP-acid ligase II